MNKKVIIQSILFFILLVSLALFFFKYFVKTKPTSSNIQETKLSLNSSENFSNTIENIEYNSNDNLGNQYTIKAKYGEILEDDSNLILMEDVKAEIIINNNKKINVSAKTAIYNIKNYDTNFKENVIIKYDKHNITGNNVDLLFKDHKIKLYNNINYNNLNTELLADVLEIDLLTKNSKIYMIDQQKKIKVIYKNNVNN